MDQDPRAPQPTRDVSELVALIKAGGVWGLAPEWVPRTGYAEPTRLVLSDVEDGLRRLMDP